MKLSTKCLGIACIALVLALCIMTLGYDTLQAEHALAVTEREQALKTAQQWQTTASTLENRTKLLQAEVQSCLEREQAAAATADQWQDILEQATRRDATEKEQQGVPDNATRRRLYLDLDSPW